MNTLPPHDESQEHPSEMQPERQDKYLPERLAAALALAVALYLVSRTNYALFHTIVDIATVFMAGSVFLVVWNGRRHLDNHYYLLIAIAFLAFGLLNFLHAIGNKGMGIFPNFGNLGPTFYIANRYVLGISFLIAPLFIKRKVRTVPVLAAYLLAVALVALSVLHWRNFPATFIEGVGLTPFKIYSDYAICLMLLGGAGLLFLNRRAFDPRVLRIIALSLAFSIATGLAFTLYTDPFGISNAVGHFFQVASFYLIYVGVVETVLTTPQNILYRNLKQSNDHVRKLNSELESLNLHLNRDIIARKEAEEALHNLNATLEQRVAAQTLEIRKAYEATSAERQRFLDVLDTLPVMITLIRPDYHVPFANRAYREALGEARGRTCYNYQFGYDQPCKECQAFIPLHTGKPHHWEWTLPNGRTFDIHNFPFTDADGSPMILEMDIDITEQRRSERILAERTAKVEQQAGQLRALAMELTRAEQKERQRLAKVLHDHIQQLIVGAQMQLSMIERVDAKLLRAAVENIDSILGEALTASRSLTVELCPPVLHQSGLAAALAWLAWRMEETQQFKVHLRTVADAEPATPELCAFLFEATREILLNAVKHAGVREARVTMLRTRKSECQIIVEDSGKGFDASTVKPGSAGGFGLFSIQQRLLYLGGTMEIESAPGRGTKATLTVPIGQAPAQLPRAAVAPGNAPAVVFKEKGRRISILLADDHKIVRQGLASLLQFESDIEIVAEAENGEQAVQLARRHQPDVVVALTTRS